MSRLGKSVAGTVATRLFNAMFYLLIALCKMIVGTVATRLFNAMFYLLIAMALVRCCTLMEIKRDQPSLNSWDPVRRAAAAQEAGRTFGGKP